MADFIKAHKKTAVNEGGYANVKGDNGGETYKGISRRYWPKWAGWAIVDKHKPLKHNAKIKDDKLDALVLEFYKLNFWDKIQGDDIEDQETAYKMYDFSVTSGIPASVKMMQRALGIPQTGKMNKALLDAINNPTKNLIK